MSVDLSKLDPSSYDKRVERAQDKINKILEEEGIGMAAFIRLFDVKGNREDRRKMEAEEQKEA